MVWVCACERDMIAVRCDPFEENLMIRVGHRHCRQVVSSALGRTKSVAHLHFKLKSPR